MPESRVAEAESLQSLLEAAVAELGLSERLLETRILLAWDEAAGPLASRARPLKVRHGKLEVAVASPVWRTQLNFVKQEIVARLNDRVGVQVIGELVLRNAGKGS
jgi:predicted nucleic acid-binding Zn ribbon protein